MSRTGVYPGSFNPPTTAHLAVSIAARDQRSLERVVWSVSRSALAKENVVHPTFGVRMRVLDAVASAIPWLELRVTDAQLLADVAEGFDVLIMGADKWSQINELRWYESESHRQSMLGRLPDLAIAPRPPFRAPDRHLLQLNLEHASTSSSKARDGLIDMMLPEARLFATRTGAWIEPDRYGNGKAGAQND